MTAPWHQLDDFLRVRNITIGPPRISQTVGGTHAPGSYHYKPYQSARDYGDADSDVGAVWDALLPYAQGPDAPLVELFGPHGLWKNGQRIHNDALQHQHADHVHAAVHPERTLPEPPSQPEELTVADIDRLLQRLDQLDAKVTLYGEATTKHGEELKVALKTYTNEVKAQATELRNSLAALLRRMALQLHLPVRTKDSAPDDPAV